EGHEGDLAGHVVLRRLSVARTDPGPGPAGPPVRRQPLGEPRGCGCGDDLHLASERQARRAACRRTPSSDVGHRTVSDAALVVALANAQADRRPTHRRGAMAHDALADAASASRLLGPFLGRRIGAKELAPVRALQTAVVAIVEALIDGSAPPLELLEWVCGN